MLDFLKWSSEKPAPVKPNGEQSIMMPQQTLVSEVDEAALKARQQYLLELALGLDRQVRGLKIQLMLAMQANELADSLRTHLCKELIQCAGLIEVEEKK